jgi:formyltetrahydrofolate-dependent phosphoribosylglycinamide formyltransferase
VTGSGSDVSTARARAYAGVGCIGIEGAQVRRDIGWRALARAGAVGGYAAAGVDIAAGGRAVELMRAAVESTHTAHVLTGVGAFGGAISANAIGARRDPVLVASTDGVGTKVVVAVDARRLSGLGHDIVNHCVNDVLVQDARPLFFLDYLGTSRLDPDQAAAIVTGMAEACRENGCVLLGGETAEMPGVYRDGHLDVVGTLVGVAERDRLLPRGDVVAGDVLVGLASSGPHTNGYSLLRKVFAGVPLDVAPDGLDVPLVDALLAPHRSYLPVLRAELDRAERRVKALAHITGGGLVENVPRVLPADCGAVVQVGSWPVPDVFGIVRDVTGLPAAELHRVLNMGIGMVLVVSRDDVDMVRRDLPEDTWVIGEVERGPRRVRLGWGGAGGPRAPPPTPAPGRGAAPPPPPPTAHWCTISGESRTARTPEDGAPVSDRPPARLVVLASGTGSNLQAILDACSAGRLRADVVAVVSDHPDAPALDRARRAGVAARALPRRNGEARRDYDARLAELVGDPRPDWVVLAGWMRILTMAFLGRFPGRVVNLHPALPGEHPGVRAIERAYDAWRAGGPAQTGVMVHLVPDEGVDDGPVLATIEVPIHADDSLETLTTRVHAAEHGLLVATLHDLTRTS